MPRTPLSGVNVYSQQAAEAFGKVDENHDRKLSFDEFSKLQPKSMSVDDQRSVFSEIDRDGSGTIEMGEYVRWSLLNSIRQAHVRAVDLFKAWDADGSHKIDKVEFRKALKSLGFVDCRKADADLVFDDLAKGEVTLDLKSLSRFVSGDLVVRNKTGLRETAAQKQGAALSLHFHIAEGNDAPPIREQLAAVLATNLQKVSTLFAHWDEDGSGTIDAREFRMGLRAVGERL